MIVGTLQGFEESTPDCRYTWYSWGGVLLLLQGATPNSLGASVVRITCGVFFFFLRGRTLEAKAQTGIGSASAVLCRTVELQKYILFHVSSAVPPADWFGHMFNALEV